MENKKRNIHTYKCLDAVYQKAKKRADKEGLKLATLIEVWIIAYGDKDAFYINPEKP